MSPLSFLHHEKKKYESHNAPTIQDVSQNSTKLSTSDLMHLRHNYRDFFSSFWSGQWKIEALMYDDNKANVRKINKPSLTSKRIYLQGQCSD